MNMNSFVGQQVREKVFSAFWNQLVYKYTNNVEVVDVLALTSFVSLGDENASWIEVTMYSNGIFVKWNPN